MSGIAGHFHLNGRPASAEDLLRSADVMLHRGPDGRGFWQDGPVGLAHLLTATTPESAAEKRPVLGGNETLVLTADARLDNRDDLFDALQSAQRGTSVDDTELIAAAYRKWGERCPEHLVGSFAFAVWDARERKLFCARDQLGTKPFYYHFAPRRFFAFASEIKSLLALPDISARLNEQRIVDSLLLLDADLESTIYRDVRRLPPAHSMVVSRNGIRCSRYWTLEPYQLTLQSNEEYAERFRELFTSAVRCRLRSGSPVAAELSGGLDSSAVTCVAGAMQSPDRPLHTISLDFPEFPECDESAYIDDVLERGDYISHRESGVRYGRLSSLADVFEYVDEPGMAVGNHHIVWQRLKMARRAGCRVLLTGFDGDTVVGHGFEQLTNLIESGQWAELELQARQYADHFRNDVPESDQLRMTVRELLQRFALPYLEDAARQSNVLRFVRAVRALERHFGVDRWKLYRRFWRTLIVPRRVAAARRAGRAHHSRLHPLIDSDFARRLGMGERLQTLRSETPRHASVQAAQLEYFASGRPAAALEAMEQYASAQGIEARHPFMDIRLIRFCVSLPNEQRFDDGWTRIILRRAMNTVVPPSICWRPGKARLSAASRFSLFDLDAELLRQRVFEPGPMRKYVDTQQLQRIHDAGRDQNGQDLNRLALVATLSYWMEEFHDRRIAQQSGRHTVDADGAGETCRS